MIVGPCGTAWYSHYPGVLAPHCPHREIHPWEVKMLLASLRNCQSRKLFTVLSMEMYLFQKCQRLDTYLVFSRSAEDRVGKLIKISMHFEHLRS